ncbi:MAG: hypothetical protein WC595_04305 [Candidatus Nanoarchaeia archaeon]
MKINLVYYLIPYNADSVTTHTVEVHPKKRIEDLVKILTFVEAVAEYQISDRKIGAWTREGPLVDGKTYRVNVNDYKKANKVISGGTIKKLYALLKVE